MKYVGGYGNSSAKLMIVGIAPGVEEEYHGRPFIGQSGQILKEDLQECGVSIDNCYLSNIFKYRLPNNEFKRHAEIGLDLQKSIAELQTEINDVNPNCILGLGDPVLYALAGKSGKHNNIGVWRGSILAVNGKKAVFTWHPSHQLHGESDEGGQYKAWQKYVRKFDIARAVKQSEFPEFRLPVRSLKIASSSADVFSFLKTDETFCAVDIEAIEGIPVCVGISFRPDQALSIPLWNLLNITCDNRAALKKSYQYQLEVSTIPTSDLAYIWHLLANFFLNRKIKFIGQNFKYDEDKLNRLGFYLHSLYADTLISQHCISSELPKSLAFQTSIYTEEPYYKFEGREFNPKSDRIRDLLLYNAKDACCTLEIWQAHRDRELVSIKGAEKSFLQFRMKLHRLYLNIERTGFKIDEHKRVQLIEKYIHRMVELESEFWQLCQTFGCNEPVNMASPKQLSILFYEILRIPKRAGTGEEVFTALLANTVKDKNKKRMLEIVLQWRKESKTVGTYLAAEPDYDGRMKTTFFITGTESFRSSTQILKQPIRNRDIGWALQTVTKHGDTGNDLRSILVADPGFVFVNIDQSQAEARVCSLLADDERTLLEYDTIDKHAATAAKFFGGREESYSKKVLGYECPQRFVGKTLRHAYHLGIGKHEAMINVNTDARKYHIDINISEWFAGQCLEKLKQDTPKIQEVYHATIQDLLARDRRLYGTFGASFYLFEDWGRDLFKAAYSRIPQQTVSDKTKSVGIWCQEHIWDCPIVGESHDALLFLCPERKVDDYVKLIDAQFRLPISFAECSIVRRDLSIPCDVELGYDYENLNKYKIKEMVA